MREPGAGAQERTAATEDAKRRQAEADRAVLERLYGPTSKAARGQSWIGVALLVLGPILIGMGAAMEGDPRLLGVGIVALGVGVWAFLDGLARARKAKAEERSRT